MPTLEVDTRIANYASWFAAIIQCLCDDQRGLDEEEIKVLVTDFIRVQQKLQTHNGNTAMAVWVLVTMLVDDWRENHKEKVVVQ
jgi:hypothetical protein